MICQNEDSDMPLVTVICRAYNHEKYIRQCLDSVVSQKTDFAYEIIVNDDCSTDSTTEIIKEYETKYENLHGIYHEENQTSKGIKVTPILINRARGKYISFCECDDYFCDEHKLQKQVNLLNNHPDCVACIHSAYRVSEDGKIIGYRKPYNAKEIMSIKEIIPCVGRLYSLNSLLCYKDAINEMGDLYYKCKVGDIPIALCLALRGDFIYSDENMAAYRVGAIGSWSKRMSKNYKASSLNMTNFIEILNILDTMTEGRYHTEIEERILSLEFGRAIFDNDLKRFFDRKYALYRKNLTMKRKMVFYFRCIISKIRY